MAIQAQGEKETESGKKTEADMSRRVVVTGMGAITPIGLSVDEFWAGIREGKIGFDRITRFDTADYKCKLAAEVKGFVGKDYMDFKAAKRMELFSQYAVAATKEAMADAGLDMEKEDPWRVGVSVGSGTGSLQAIERSHSRMVEKGPGRIEPLFVPLTISNMAAGNVSIQFGLKGKSINVVTACATGTNSIGEAFRAIQYGDAEVMIAGGTEGSICQIGVGGFSALTALSTSEDPQRGSIPFDKERGGFVMGEGSAVLVLEELEHALARGAKIYAEVVGGGLSADAYHLTATHPEGLGAILAMTNALEDAGMQPEDIDYINVHGTSTPVGDISEVKAIKEVFGEHAYKLNISSTKSMTGHLLGATGALEAMFSVKAVQEDIVPPTINHMPDDLDENIDYNLNFTFDRAQNRPVRAALSNSFGFGGHNATVIVKKFEK